MHARKLPLQASYRPSVDEHGWRPPPSGLQFEALFNPTKGLAAAKHQAEVATIAWNAISTNTTFDDASSVLGIPSPAPRSDPVEDFPVEPIPGPGADDNADDGADFDAPDDSFGSSPGGGGRFSGDGKVGNVCFWVLI